MQSVIVALIGDPADPAQGIQGDRVSGDGVPYDSLPKVAFRVSRTDVLVDVLKKAVDAFEVAEFVGREHLPNWVAFYRPEDEDGGYSVQRETANVLLVDDSNRVVWDVWFKDPSVTFGALLDSAEAGALQGDPLRPYLTLRPGYGNGLFPGWADYVLILFMVREALGIIADVHGAVGALRAAAESASRLFQRFRRNPEIVQENSEQWSMRGGQPASFHALIARQPWKSDVLAGLLGSSIEETEELLKGRGSVLDNATGLWHPKGDSEGAVLHRVIVRVTHTDEWMSIANRGEAKEAVQREITDRVREVLADEIAEEE